MAKNDKSKKVDESRRSFLKTTSLAAAGIVMTPIFTACGGEEENKRGRGRGGRQRPTNNNNSNNKPAGNNNNASSGPELVDSADAVGARGTLKIISRAKKPDAARGFVSLPDDATNGEQASQINDGNGPYDDNYVVVDAAGGKGLADLIFVVDVKEGKALKWQGEPGVGVNSNFRFTRSIVTGEFQSVSYEVWDAVQHAVNITSRGQKIWDGAGSAANTAPGEPELVTSSGLLAGYYEVKCSMHSWELGHVYVSKHNYVGVTSNPHDKDSAPAGIGWEASWDHLQGSSDPANYGVVEIADIPVGEHDVKVYHNGSEVGSFKVNIAEGENEATFDQL